MTVEQMKAWIDAASYQELLEQWRFAPVGATMFQGEMGNYAAKKLAEKKAAIPHASQVAASKAAGWEQ